MSTYSAKPSLIVIGDDSRLVYLLERYAHQCGYQMIQFALSPRIDEIQRIMPSSIIFSSLEHLQAANTLIDALADSEVPILVCASMADESRARELGADECMLHPLTYQNFIGALSAIHLIDDR